MMPVRRNGWNRYALTLKDDTIKNEDLSKRPEK